MNKMIQNLESRILFHHLPITPPRVDLRADTNRDGVISVLDNADEKSWTYGKTGRGATALPNVDRDNTTNAAPDNWTGGNWNGKYIPANQIIDNAADLNDIARIRLLKLLEVDSSYIYDVSLKILPGEVEGAWLNGVKPEDRVRVFMPTREISKGRILLQPGDSAILGPGLGSEIKFVNDPKEPNEYPLSLIKGDGYIELGVEGLKMGSTVRFELIVSYKPVIIFDTALVGDPVDEEIPFDEPDVLTDTLTMRVAPFTLLDHRYNISNQNNSVIIDQFDDNAQMRSTMKQLFGDSMIEGNAGDMWQQDGSEIGYVDAGYARIPIVLELPRSRGEPFTGGTGIRSFIRDKLLAANVGVSTEVAAYPNDTSSAYGGDIEALPDPENPTGPSLMLRSVAMPTYLKNFFDAQGVNRAIEINPDRWLAVGHVDEVVHLSSDGKHVMMADADLGYAMLLLSHQLNPRARMHTKVGGAEYMPNYTEEGIQIADFLKNGRMRRFNLEKVMDRANLPAAHRMIMQTLGLNAEVSTPRDNTTTASLSQAGVFTQLLGKKRRYFEMVFTDSKKYELRYRDAGGSWSDVATGDRTKDGIFNEAKAYLYPKYFSGTFKSGDTFTFRTNPDATFIRLPTTFVNNMTLQDFGSEPIPDGFEEEAMRNPAIAFTMNNINSLSAGNTVVTARSYGPMVDIDGSGAKDIFDIYVGRAFKSGGYDKIQLVDARMYHNGSGGVHCGTNVFRDFDLV